MTSIHTKGTNSNPPNKKFTELAIGDWFITQGEIGIKINSTHAFFIKSGLYSDMSSCYPSHLITNVDINYESTTNR